MLTDLSPHGAIFVEVGCLSVAFIFLLLYWYVRACILRQFAASDVLITFAWIFMLANVICDSISVKLGLWNPKIKYTTHGLPDYERFIPDRDTLQKALKLAYGTIPIYYAVLYEVKAAILIMYLKLFPKNFVKLRFALYLTIAFVTVGLALVLGLNFLWCVPVQRNWTLVPEDRCLSYASLTPYFFSSGFHILSDLAIFALPFFLLPKFTANAPRRKVAGIYAIFSLGLLCIVCTVVRIISVGRSSTSALIAAWSAAEMGVAVVVACCPPLKYLLYASRRRGSSAASGSHSSRRSRKSGQKCLKTGPSLTIFKTGSLSKSKLSFWSLRGHKQPRVTLKQQDAESTVAIATVRSGTITAQQTGGTATMDSSYMDITGTDQRSAALTNVDLESELADSYGGLSPRGSARPVASMPPVLLRLSSSSYSPPVSAVGEGSVVSISRNSSTSSRNYTSIPNITTSTTNSFDSTGPRRSRSLERKREYTGWRKWIRGGNIAKESQKPKKEFADNTFGGGNSTVRSTDWRSRERIREEDEPEEALNSKFIMKPTAMRQPSRVSPPPRLKYGGALTAEEKYEMKQQKPLLQSPPPSEPQHKFLQNVDGYNPFNAPAILNNTRRGSSSQGQGAGFGFLNSEYMDGRRPSAASANTTLTVESRRTSRSSYVNGGDNVCGNFGSSIFGGD